MTWNSTVPSITFWEVADSNDIGGKCCIPLYIPSSSSNSFFLLASLKCGWIQTIVHESCPRLYFINDYLVRLGQCRSRTGFHQEDLCSYCITLEGNSNLENEQKKQALSHLCPPLLNGLDSVKWLGSSSLAMLLCGPKASCGGYSDHGGSKGERERKRVCMCECGCRVPRATSVDGTDAIFSCNVLVVWCHLIGDCVGAQPWRQIGRASCRERV